MPHQIGIGHYMCDVPHADLFWGPQAGIGRPIAHISTKCEMREMCEMHEMRGMHFAHFKQFTQ